MGAGLAFALYSHSCGAQWDLDAYMRAARAVWVGESPYWIEDENLPFHLTKLTTYVYPPLLARLLSPLCLLPMLAVRALWLLAQSMAFETLYWIGLALFGKRFSPLSWAAFHLVGLFSDGVMTDYRAGNTALMEAAVIALWAYRHMAFPLSGGASLGVLAAIKPLVIFNSLWDLTRGRWKAWSATAAASLLLYGAMLFDGSLFTEYREFLASNTFKRIMDEHTVGIFNNATVSAAFRLFTSQTFFKPVIDFPPLAYAMTFGVPLVVWLAAFRAWRQMEEAGLSREEQNRMGFLLLLPTVLLTIPRVADYTLVWLLVPLFFGVWETWRDRSRVACVFFLMAAVIGNLPIRPSRLDDFTLSYHLLQYRYVSLVLFWFAGWWSIRYKTVVSTAR